MVLTRRLSRGVMITYQERGQRYRFLTQDSACINLPFQPAGGVPLLLVSDSEENNSGNP